MKKPTPFKISLAAVAAILIFVGCGRNKPSRTHVLEVINASSEVVALQQRPGHEIVFDRDVESRALFTEKFRHTYEGLEVMGSGVSYHLNPQETESVSAHLAQVKVSTLPKVSLSQAQGLARNLIGDKELGTSLLKIMPAHAGHPDRLVYVFALRPTGELWMNAMNGAHIATLEESSQAMEVVSAKKQGILLIKRPQQECSVSTLQGENTKILDRISCQEREAEACQVLNWDSLPQILNPGKCKTPSKRDESAQRALLNAKKFLSYFQEVHGRDSFDDRGAKIVSVVHAGINYANATWFKKGQYLAYGDGDGVEFRDFTFALDVAGHEMTHGVIQNSANLASLGESGAINESLADYFGKMIEGEDDWNFGAKLFIDSTSGKALRDLLNPGRLLGDYKNEKGEIVSRAYPAKVSEQAPAVEPCIGDNDYCGIHYNVTIPGHSWYLIHQKLGKSRARELIYLALTHYFHELTDFQDAADGTLKACQTLYSEEDCSEVRKIFKTTGMLP
jgi:Zn-dependent metalloprotease